MHRVLRYLRAVEAMASEGPFSFLASYSGKAIPRNLGEEAGIT